MKLLTQLAFLVPAALWFQSRPVVADEQCDDYCDECYQYLFEHCDDWTDWNCSCTTWRCWPSGPGAPFCS